MYNNYSDYWLAYKNLESEVENLSYYISFSDAIVEQEEVKADSTKPDSHFSQKKYNVRNSQLYTYSNKIADLLVSCCIQIEAAFLKLATINKSSEHKSNDESYENESEKIGRTVDSVNKTLKIAKKQIKIISPYADFNRTMPDFFSPMGYNKGDENDYYSAYCAIKHNRFDKSVRYKANVNCLIRALGALYILNLYLAIEEDTYNFINEIDLSFGSKFFSAKYSLEKKTDEAIIVIERNPLYEQKLEEYCNQLSAESLPLEGMLDYSESNPEPKRFTVKLCK